MDASSMLLLQGCIMVAGLVFAPVLVMLALFLLARLIRSSVRN